MGPTLPPRLLRYPVAGAGLAARLLTRLLFAALLVVATVMLARATASLALPDLQPWHTFRFRHEFDAARADPAAGWDAYLLAEAAVFRELEALVARAGSAVAGPSRYDPASVAWPGREGRNWNRSFEMRPDGPAWAGIVLVHGLTDSPYSLRAVAEAFRARGVLVLVPRMPGHGTTPSGLLGVDRDDWRAVVAMAMAELRHRLGPERPLLIGGYSNGAALALRHAVDALDDPALERPRQIYLLSPAIGVSAFGRFAGWHRVLAVLPGLEKFRWDLVLPEFDPYKYNSFPKIAGHQNWALTHELEADLARLSRDGRAGELPPVLAFQSLADATVDTEAVAGRLFDRLARGRHELVLFDLNREDSLQAFFDSGYRDLLTRLVALRGPGYGLTVVGGGTDAPGGVVATRYAPGGEVSRMALTGLAWPPGVYSLSHVAVPFPADDPLYGEDGRGFGLGGLAHRGERGIAIVPDGFFNRLRYNPFFPYVEARIEDFLAPLAVESQP